MRGLALLLPPRPRALIGPALVAATAATAIAWGIAAERIEDASPSSARVTLALLDPDPSHQQLVISAIADVAGREGAALHRLGTVMLRQAVGSNTLSEVTSVQAPVLFQFTMPPGRAAPIADRLRRLQDVDVQVDVPGQGVRPPFRLAPLALLLLAGAAASWAGWASMSSRRPALLLLGRLGATRGQILRDATIPLGAAAGAGSLLAAMLAWECLAPAQATGAVWIVGASALLATAAVMLGGLAALLRIWRKLW